MNEIISILNKKMFLIFLVFLKFKFKFSTFSKYVIIVSLTYLVGDKIMY